MDYKPSTSTSPVITQVSNPSSSSSSSSSQPSPQNLSCTAWCKGATEQLDDIFGKSSAKSADVLVSLAGQQGLLNNSNLSVHQDLKLVDKSVHEFAQLLSCQGLLPLRLSNNGYAQREYSLFLNYINTAMLHLSEAIKRSE